MFSIENMFPILCFCRWRSYLTLKKGEIPLICHITLKCRNNLMGEFRMAPQCTLRLVFITHIDLRKRMKENSFLLPIANWDLIQYLTTHDIARKETLFYLVLIKTCSGAGWTAVWAVSYCLKESRLHVNVPLMWHYLIYSRNYDLTYLKGFLGHMKINLTRIQYDQCAHSATERGKGRCMNVGPCLL